MEKTIQKALNDLRRELISIRESGVNVETLAEEMCDAIIFLLDGITGERNG